MRILWLRRFGQLYTSIVGMLILILTRLFPHSTLVDQLTTAKKTKIVSVDIIFIQPSVIRKSWFYEPYYVVVIWTEYGKTFDIEIKESSIPENIIKEKSVLSDHIPIERWISSFFSIWLEIEVYLYGMWVVRLQNDDIVLSPQWKNDLYDKRKTNDNNSRFILFIIRIVIFAIISRWFR
jgi:hypothetical protein